MNEYLEKLQVGDKVVVRHCGGAGQEMIEHTTVKKITKTQITVEYGVRGMRFLKRNGWKVGECQKTRGWFTFLYSEDEWNKM